MALQAKLDNAFSVQAGADRADLPVCVVRPLIYQQSFPVICCPGAACGLHLFADLGDDAVKHCVLFHAAFALLDLNRHPVAGHQH